MPTTNTSEYELVVLYRPELESKIEAPLKKVANIITTNGGKIVSEDDWGRRELAYSIAGETHAVYRVYTLELPSEAPAAISSVLNITDEVVRYLLSKVDAKAQAVLAEEKTRKVASTDTTDEK
ncbi:MAG TPA: 30S ribosomal protein S6 [Candidatus Nanoperiomorbaceae bacterium]|nr:MAG: 30S ribosomal protein S6 [Candidatus Saccharibacteria bacterium]HMQ09629.1 30S ribosomal protein S6 [Candidatus Nanoperiomorbaceae bacterium]HMQ97195.1 30S ribosomal protein S6 [Candidatus Nanoperiomorbaceae bacterium]HMR85836.1 30S ribosomal protein S6 [Candidatus Nanoperiomorbaceae bacterium]HMU12001.1 30S ribosomal protein S6 [Candidatus Nanoperiomorbaceae bacterium]